VTPTLRPYQRALVDETHAAWRDARNVLAVMATGGGKSVVIGDIVTNEPERTCVIAHRQELVSQLSRHLARSGVAHRIVAPKNVAARCAAEHRSEFGRSFVDPGARAAVAGVDTLRRAEASRAITSMG
jgi:superfamily II DNA or RNA helicase